MMANRPCDEGFFFERDWSMHSLVIAYLLGWLAISSYVVWLAIQQRSLARRIEELHLSREEVQSNSQQHVRAA